MMKALALAALGTALLIPVAARAQATPDFVAASACEAAAPLRTDALANRRAVRAERSAVPRDRAAQRVRTPQQDARDRAAPPMKGRGAQVPTAESELQVDETPVVRRAVHFCLRAIGGGRVWAT